MFKSLIFVIFAIALFPGLPPQTTFPFAGFSIPPLRKLEGSLAINNHLDRVERLFEGQLYGPEAVLVRGQDIYTGVYGGEIVRINGPQITPVARIGRPCESLLDEEVCGRPLGLAFDTQGNNLIVADAYYGIWEVDLTSGAKKQLVSRDEVLDGSGVNRKPRLFNSVTVAKNGDIFWTESCSDFDLQEAVFSIFANPSGRLFKFDRSTKQNTVLLDQLYFANGVALSPNDEFVLVSETFSSRIRRVYLKGPKALQNDVFVDGLPGLPDNLSADKDGLWVPLDVAADEDQDPSLTRLISNVPLIRKFCVRALYLAKLPFNVVNWVMPNAYTQRLAYAIGHFELLNFLIPARTTVVRMDWNGQIVAALHGSDGSTGRSATHAVRDGQYLYLGSVRNRFLGRVMLPEVLRAPEPAPIHEKIADDVPRPKQPKLKVIKKGGEHGEL